MNRVFDVVLYGASGFVGQQTVAYFAQNFAQLRWAIAGRSKDKLQAIARRYGFDDDQSRIIVANSNDAAALLRLAHQTHVVLSSAGPYAIFGTPLVDACVVAQTHYVDITGETPWVRQLIDKHHDQARKDGTRIVPCCGFDSVPSDIGAWLTARAVYEHFGEPCTDIKAAFSIRGGLNGGTLASLLNIAGTEQNKQFEKPFLLNPDGTQPSDLAMHEDVIAPHRDMDFNAWVGPFVMGPINTRVVRRSVALRRINEAKNDAPAFADTFHYQEYARFGTGAKAAVTAAGVSWGMNATQIGLLFSPVRKLAQRLGPAPGEGPSEAAMDSGGFKCDFVGGTALRGQQVRGRIATKGDPGNRATTKFVCEAAAALVMDKLPGGKAFGGVLTPSTAIGQALVDRLVAKGVQMDFAPMA